MSKINAIKTLYQPDHIAADLAPATIPNLLSNVDGEAVVATANRTRSNTLNIPTQSNVALVGDTLNQH